MEATNLASRGIVQEVLTKDNYKRWKNLMTNYLVGKDLWDTVSSDCDAPRRKNAKALHIIQLSCEPKISDEISHFEKARQAWDHLASRYDSELKAELDIEQGVVVDDLPAGHRDLYEYVKNGNWKGAYSFIDQKKKSDVNVLFWAPDPSLRTVLHVATMAGHVYVVNELVKLGEAELVKMQDREGYTALALAAHYTGDVDVAKCMVENMEAKVRQELLTISINMDDTTEIPLLLAADKGHKQMTRYLYSNTLPTLLSRQDSHNRVVLLLERCIKAEIFDVALGLLHLFPQLPTESLSCGSPALNDLAQMPSAFLSGCQFGFLQKIIYDIVRVEMKKLQNNGEGCHQETNISGGLLNVLGIREIYEKKCTHYQVQEILRGFQFRVAKLNNSQLSRALVYDAMLHAAKHGIFEFIDAMRTANQDLLWVRDRDKRGIFSYAILHRKHKVFQLIQTLNGRNDIFRYHTDVFGNNLLHLAGHLGPSSEVSQRPGAALQMQREIQWFKAVEKVVHPKCKEDKNDDGKKPHELFTETHEKLAKAGEKSAKETARSFTLVGTIIIGITFAAAFSVPGGYYQESSKKGNHPKPGVPIFLNDVRFILFLVADALSLFTSTISVITFIAIMTSRFTQKDFLKTLPWKLLRGLIFLFLSVMFMLVSFCAAFAIILEEHKDYKLLFIGAIICSSISVMVLILSQVSLICEIFQSTTSNPISYIKEKKK